jgi:hypothetical protein
MNNNLSNSKVELIQWLASLKDESIISDLLALRNKLDSDWWSEISESEKTSIKKGLNDLDNNNTISNSEVKKLYEKWL